MAITKQIIFKGDATDAVNAADEVAESFKDVDREAGKANNQIENVTSNGGAIAILDRLTGGLASQFRDAFEATKLFNTSLKATRGALLATGIGALVVALGVVVAYWDEILDFVKGTTRELEKQKEEINLTIKSIDTELSILKLQRDEYNLIGKSIEGINKEEKKTLIAKQSNLIAQNAILASQLKYEKSKIFEVNLLEQANNLLRGLPRNFTVATEEELKRLREIQDNINANQITILELNNAILALDKQQEEANKPKGDDASSKERTEQSIVNSITPAGVDPLSDPRVILEEGVADRIAEVNKGLTEVLIEEANRRQGIAEIEANSRIALEENTWAFLNAIAKEGSDVSKGLAIASIIREQVSSVSGIISNTAIANAKALSLSPATFGQPFITFNNIAAGLGIGASVAGATKSISQILSDSNTPLQDSSGISGQSASSQAPSFNLVRGTGENQLLEGITQQQEPIRAYVLSDEVRTASAADRNASSEASLG